MGWGFLDPTKLFRKNWDTPGELAMELYSQATDRTPATVDRPVTIQQTGTEPALKIEAPPPRQEPDRIELFSPRPEPSREYRPRPEAGGFPIPQPSRVQTEQAAQPKAPVQAAKTTPAPPPESSARGLGKVLAGIAGRAFSAYPGVVAPAPQVRPPPQAPLGTSPTFETLAAPGVVVPTTTPTPGRSPAGDAASRSLAPRPSAPESLPDPYSPRRSSFPQAGGREPAEEHPSPTVDIAGPVVFRGPEPSQFSVAPQVWDPTFQKYVSYPPPSVLAQNLAPWITNANRIGFVQQMSAADLSDPSNPIAGLGQVMFYSVSDDGTGFTQADDGRQPQVACSLMQFPWSSWGVGVLIGDNWFMWPLGPVCTATGKIPANSHASCLLRADYGGAAASIDNDMSVAVDNGSGGSVTIIAAIDFNGKLKAIAQNCTA